MPVIDCSMLIKFSPGLQSGSSGGCVPGPGALWSPQKCLLSVVLVITPVTLTEGRFRDPPNEERSPVFSQNCCGRHRLLCWSVSLMQWPAL